MTNNARFFISHLQLQPHPEGGYFRETYRAGERIASSALPSRFNRDLSFSTAIYYLLQQGDFSAFHRIKSDECWHFYAGGTLLIHLLKNDGTHQVVKLGNQPAEGETFQFTVPANTWFASEPAARSSFVLTGCTVAPGFDFTDFEMADRQLLLDQFPQHMGIISRLSR